MAKDLPSTSLMIFGVSGDLSRRYLLPALSEICDSSDIRASLKIVGISRQDLAPKDLLGKKLKNLNSQFETYKLDYSDPAQFKKLKSKIKSLGTDQTIFYFAVPPDAVLTIAANLGKAGLNGKNIKLLVEKPFGTDLASAKKIIKQVNKHFDESQVYRIDHYLAKEMAQNIAVFLGSNSIFRSVWSNKFIEYIEIVVAEKISIEGRSGFYKQTGALRDIIQSHGLQLAALTIMEPCPHDFDFSQLPQRRFNALKKLKVQKSQLGKTVFKGQYQGFKNEVDNPRSQTETFTALQLASSDPRWKGVPVYLATGKNLDQRLTQIRINFKSDNSAEANTLILRVQPREGIELDLWVKQPGYDRQLQKKRLSFSYEQDFEGRLPNAYEQIIVDAIRGSQSLFASSGEVLESWRIIQPIIDYWKNQKSDPVIYQPGSSVEQILSN